MKDSDARTDIQTLFNLIEHLRRDISELDDRTRNNLHDLDIRISHRFQKLETPEIKTPDTSHQFPYRLAQQTNDRYKRLITLLEKIQEQLLSKKK